MQEGQFEVEIADISSYILNSLETYFLSKAINFSKESFMKQSSVDLDQLGRDAFFFGADTFPIETNDRIVAA